MNYECDPEVIAHAIREKREAQWTFKRIAEWLNLTVDEVHRIRKEDKERINKHLQALSEAIEKSRKRGSQ